MHERACCKTHHSDLWQEQNHDNFTQGQIQVHGVVCAHQTPLWNEALFFIFAFKICLRHQSFTPFLRGAPLVRKILDPPLIQIINEGVCCSDTFPYQYWCCNLSLDDCPLAQSTVSDFVTGLYLLLWRGTAQVSGKQPTHIKMGMHVFLAHMFSKTLVKTCFFCTFFLLLWTGRHKFVCFVWDKCFENSQDSMTKWYWIT